MFYDYICSQGCPVATVQAPMSVGPTAPSCEHGPMQRVYGTQGAPAIIQWDTGTYLDRAYRGEEDTGMRLTQVRAILDAQGAERSRGRRNNHDYGDKHRTRR